MLYNLPCNHHNPVDHFPKLKNLLVEIRKFCGNSVNLKITFKKKVKISY